jgi:arylsulfatase A-like enzyme
MFAQRPLHLNMSRFHVSRFSVLVAVATLATVASWVVVALPARSDQPASGPLSACAPHAIDAEPLDTMLDAIAELVVVVSIDGLRYDAIGAHTPALHKLRRTGASSSAAYTIRNSTTLPSHASMLSGVDTDQHGIDFNAFRPERGIIRSSTAFRIARAYGYRTAMVVSKQKFRHLVEPDGVELFSYAGSSCERVTSRANALLNAGFTGLLFVHMSETDVAGHRYGWMSAPYHQAAQQADRCLGELIQAFEQRPDYQRALMIVTSDHGGHGRVHGSMLEEDRHIPWILWGGVAKQRHAISLPVSTVDTAVTALHALGISAPAAMRGKAVTEGLSPASYLPRLACKPPPEKLLP